MPSPHYDIIIVGTGPAGLGAAFHLSEASPSLSILMIDREKICSGGLLNDCKQNYTYPIGFVVENWTREEAERLLPQVERCLQPIIMAKKNLEVYRRRAERIGVTLLDIRQAHVGTDRSKALIRRLMAELENRGVRFRLECEVTDVFDDSCGPGVVVSGSETLRAGQVIVAPGRKGFSFLQQVMERMGIDYIDNEVDVGIRLETTVQNYSIVTDYYDPKFIFPDRVRTFCTNSGHARVVLERYQGFNLVNGHALSAKKPANNLVNFALLKTIGLKDPVRSGQQMAVYLGRLANEIGGGKPLMQRVGDFRMGKRSNAETFNEDLYSFPPSCPVTAGDLGLAVPAKIMRHLWAAMKKLDTILPGILHPSTIMYYPEIKMYANKPAFLDRHFRVSSNVYMVGDGAGTSRGITGAWASGIRAAEGIQESRAKS
ncbi:MAG: pyridine nucleotide-disulfide oxidoreductase [Deltaproteobacteria bacterium]|nr:pyridine nucleotide-disulfide oxidoreductase [Deltaproteobacteria bacterium]